MCTVNELFLVFSLNKIEFKIMKFVLERKTNKDKSTKIFPPIRLQPTEIHACAMPRAKKDQKKVPILKKTTGLCPSRSYYSPGPPRGDPGAGCELAHATAAGPGEAQDHHRQDRLLRANSESAV